MYIFQWNVIFTVWFIMYICHAFFGPVWRHEEKFRLACLSHGVYLWKYEQLAWELIQSLHLPLWLKAPSSLEGLQHVEFQSKAHTQALLSPALSISIRTHTGKRQSAPVGEGTPIFTETERKSMLEVMFKIKWNLFFFFCSENERVSICVVSQKA